MSNIEVRPSPIEKLWAKLKGASAERKQHRRELREYREEMRHVDIHADLDPPRPRRPRLRRRRSNPLGAIGWVLLFILGFIWDMISFVFSMIFGMIGWLIPIAIVIAFILAASNITVDTEKLEEGQDEIKRATDELGKTIDDIKERFKLHSEEGENGNKIIIEWGTKKRDDTVTEEATE